MTSNFYTLLDKKWYYHLLSENGLLYALRREPKLIVMRVTMKNGASQHSFAEFADHYEFWNYYLKMPAYDRCFNEVPIDACGQKMRFDLDMPNSTLMEAQVLISCLIYAIYTIYKNYNIELDLSKDLIFFTSSTNVNNDQHIVNEKLSYHILVLNYYCFDAADARYLGNQILELTRSTLPIEYYEKSKTWLDPAIFGTNHPLRIYGCVKPLTTRVKQWLKKWTFLYNNTNSIVPIEISTQLPAEDDLTILKLSLISWVKDCKLLKIELPKSDLLKVEVNVSETILLQIPEWLKLVDPDQAFKLDCQKGNRIWLKRLKPSFCKICKHSHDSMNPYFRVTPYKVTFSCGRSTESIIVADSSAPWLVKNDNPIDIVDNQVQGEILRSNLFDVDQRLQELTGESKSRLY